MGTRTVFEKVGGKKYIFWHDIMEKYDNKLSYASFILNFADVYWIAKYFENS